MDDDFGADRFARLSDVLAATDARLREGRSAAPPPWPTGFDPLDSYLSGGLRPGELTLLGGPQGLGKTTWALQVARHVLAAGHPVLYVCYEHDAVNLLERLIAAEAGERAGVDAVPLRSVRALLEGDGSAQSLSDKLAETPGGAEALASVSHDLQLLFTLRGGVNTGVSDIAQSASSIAAAGLGQPLVVVDYVQKVRVTIEALEEEVRVARIAGELKDLALTNGAPVLAISASDTTGISEGVRLRTEHLRGATGLAYEADVVLLLNEKYDVVARHHLVYGSANAERFHNYAVLSIEKNRGGMSGVDIDLRKQFHQSRFDRTGQLTEEQLVDARVFRD